MVKSKHNLISLIAGVCFLSMQTMQPMQSKAAETDSTEPDPFTEQIQAVIASWAGAWQSQFFTTYITHYHPEFEPEEFETRQAWREDRRERIMEPEFIRIALRDFNLLEQGFEDQGGDWVRVQFWLSYRRPDYADQSLKEIVLRQRNGLWLIAEERNLEVNIISD